MPQTPSPEAFDAIREQNPDLGFALYAIEPGGPVALEIYTPDGGIFKFVGESAAAVLAEAFPPAAPMSEVAPDIFD